MRRLTLAAVALLSFSTGCSWIFMNRAPDPVYAPNYPVECTTSSAAPVLDSLGLAYFVLNTIVVADDVETYGTGGVLLSGGLGAMFLASALTGFSSAGHCDTVKQLNAMCITGSGDACRRLSPLWRPPAREERFREERREDAPTAVER